VLIFEELFYLTIYYFNLSAQVKDKERLYNMESVSLNISVIFSVYVSMAITATKFLY
jgi:hypothetical protein